jgi:hypothetical protein
MSVCLKKESKTRGAPLPEEEAAMRRLNNRSGVSIIAVVFLIVVVAFLGVIVVSLFVTQSSQSVGELNSTQALYIADGGIEYAFRAGTFPNYSYPVWSSRAGASATNPCPSGTGIVLGQGEFCVDPPTVLTGPIGTSVPVNIPVVSTTGFPSAGLIRIDSEVIQYTSTTATTFNVPNIASYRGYAGTSAAAHTADAGVYPATTLGGGALPNDCTALSSIPVNFDTSEFLSSGVIKIDSEYFHYTGKSALAFGTGVAGSVTRCFKGSTSTIHTPTTAVYQLWITSTGSVSTIFGGTAQRVVRVTLTQ